MRCKGCTLTKRLKSVTVGLVLLFPQMRPILYKDFEAALRIIKPSVSDKDLELYVDWNRQFGCGLNSHIDWICYMYYDSDGWHINKNSLITFLRSRSLWFLLSTTTNRCNVSLFTALVTGSIVVTSSTPEACTFWSGAVFSLWILRRNGEFLDSGFGTF